MSDDAPPQELTPEELAAANARRFTPEELAAAEAHAEALPVVERPEDVPIFPPGPAGDEAFGAFWDTHAAGPGLADPLAGLDASARREGAGAQPAVGGHAAPAGRGPRLTPDELAEANRPLTPEEEAAVPELEEVDEVPVFATTAEADAWWDTHQPSGAAIARWRAVPGNAAAVEARAAVLRERRGVGTQAGASMSDR